MPDSRKQENKFIACFAMLLSQKCSIKTYILKSFRRQTKIFNTVYLSYTSVIFNLLRSFTKKLET